MLLQEIKKYLSDREQDLSSIREERKAVLDRVSEYIRDRLLMKKKAELLYICPENARTSHFGQMWAQAAAAFCNLPQVYSYSGGNEITTFHLSAIKAARKAGFMIEMMKEGNHNPVYRLIFDDDKSPRLFFSKRFDDPANPCEGFCAILTCSEADEAFPHIPGAVNRISCIYPTPEISDNTPEQEAAYEETCRIIATESLYVMKKAKAMIPEVVLSGML